MPSISAMTARDSSCSARKSARVWDARTGDPAGPPVRVKTQGKGIGLDRLGRLSRNGSRVAGLGR